MSKQEPTTLEWVSVTYRTTGLGATVTVTRRRENVTAKWSVRAASSALGPAVKDARAQAESALIQVLEVTP